MKRVVINQSNYLPWKGYFDMIHDADFFIFYDDVQYTNRDWRNRNLIKTMHGMLWLTIPVGSDRKRLIQEVVIENSKWQKLHWETICHHYKKAQFFYLYKEFFENIYLNQSWDNLSHLNHYLIENISFEFLKIKTKFLRSSEFKKNGGGKEAILSILKEIGATNYISGPRAKSYLNKLDFEQNNINLTWKDYDRYPEYPQFYGDFNHKVSIIDLLFHTGPNAPYYIWGWRS